MVKLDYQPADPTRTWRYSVLLKIGLAMIVFGTGPLIIEHLYDPNINDIATGMLAGCTLWPGIALTLAGTIISLSNRRNAKRQAPPLPNDGERK